MGTARVGSNPANCEPFCKLVSVYIVYLLYTTDRVHKKACSCGLRREDERFESVRYISKMGVDIIIVNCLLMI